MKIQGDSIYLSDNDSDDTKIIEELFKYFGQDEKRKQICIILPGNEPRIIYRQDLYELAKLSSKNGYGTSSGSVLPGTADPSRLGLRFLKYRCPVGGCGFETKRISFRPPPICNNNNHPKTTMVLVP